MDSEFLNSKDCDYVCYKNPLHAVIAGTRDAARTTVSGGPSGKNHSVGPGEGRSRSLFTAHPNLPHILLSHTFSISCHISCPPHTLKRQTAANSGKKRPYYTAQSGHGAIITHRTPVSCVTMCNGVQGVEKNMRSLCKSVQ